MLLLHVECSPSLQGFIKWESSLLEGEVKVQTIPFSLAAPGMELARDIKNPESPDGPPICGKCVVLTETLISRLKSKGIQAITVTGHPVKMEGDKLLPEQLASLDRRFRHVLNDPLMVRIRELYRKKLIRSMGE